MYAQVTRWTLQLRRTRGATALEYAFLVIFVAWILNWARFLILPVNKLADFLQHSALPHP